MPTIPMSSRRGSSRASEVYRRPVPGTLRRRGKAGSAWWEGVILGRLCQQVVAVALAVGATQWVAAQSSPPRPDTPLQDPEKLFRKACERLMALEAKHDLLKGLSEVKPAITRDDNGRLKGAHFIFQRN